MNVKLIAYHQGKALPVPNPKFGGIRRIFNNEQLIERFDKWLLICGKAANTRQSYTFAVRQFAESLINKPLTAATKEDVRAFVAQMYAKGLAPRTMQVRLDALRVFFDCLQLGNQVRVSVARLVDRRKIPGHLPRILSEGQIGKIIDAARSPRDLAIVELLYASGVRVSELAHLRCEDVDLKARTLIVRQGKGGDDRIALLGRKAARALHEYLGDRVSGSLFQPLPNRRKEGPRAAGVWKDRYGTWRGAWRERTAHGKTIMQTVRLGDYELPTRERARMALDAFLSRKPKPKVRYEESPVPARGLTARQIFRIVVRLAKRAGVEGVHPHIFRHSMATHCLNRGMDIRHVQELLGHTTLVATQKYLHLSTTQLKSIHDKFFPKGRKTR